MQCSRQCASIAAVLCSALMLEADYKPKGWLGLIMGSRLYYSFHGDDVQTEAVFESRLDSLTKEIGRRGLAVVPEAVPPAAHTVRAELIGHYQPCMTDIYLHIDARMADYIRTHRGENRMFHLADPLARRERVVMYRMAKAVLPCVRPPLHVRRLLHRRNCRSSYLPNVLQHSIQPGSGVAGLWGEGWQLVLK